MKDAIANMPHIEIHTDGACSGNPGPGGWGALLRYGQTEKEMSGGESHTTNNRMELLGAIEGLRSLQKPCRVRLVSDSQYLVKGLTEWIDGWKRRGWKRKEGPVMNVELWQELDRLRGIHDHRRVKMTEMVFDEIFYTNKCNNIV